MTPEEKARLEIDSLLYAAGWMVQSRDDLSLSGGHGVAVRELSFKKGEPDYTLFVDAKAIGTVEAEPQGHTLIGVEEQSTRYVTGVRFLVDRGTRDHIATNLSIEPDDFDNAPSCK